MPKIRQFPETVKLTSWRHFEIDLKPHELRDIGFYDTNPNIFMVSNPNEATLKFGISKVPTANNFEFKINYSSSDVFGRPTGSGHLYVLNDSSINVSFTLFSLMQDFDPAIMKGTNVLVDLDDLETRAIIQGTAEGVKLPIEAPELLTKVNQIYNKMQDKPTIGDAVYANNVESINMTFTSGGSYMVFDWLFNDGDDAVITVGGTEVFTIKNGEGFGDLEFKVHSAGQVEVKASSGTASLRAKYHSEMRVD